MKLSIAAGLDPLAVLFSIEIGDPEGPFRGPVWCVRLDISDEADKSRIAFEDHVELTHAVAFHPIRALRVNIVIVHVLVDASDHGAGTFDITKPVLMVSGAQFGCVLIYEGLEDAINMSANRVAVGLAIILRCGCDCRRGVLR